MHYFDYKLSNGSSGERIYWLRSFVIKNRNEFCAKHDININTLLSWESDTTTVTEKGAKKLIEAFNKEGVLCGFEWLLKGTGSPPQSIAAIARKVPAPEGAKPVNYFNSNIQNEQNFFLQFNPGAKTYNVIDDSMEPAFYEGDLLGYIPVHPPFNNAIIGTTMIVKIDGQRLVLRKIFRGSNEKVFKLAAINPATQINDPIMFDVKPTEVYRIIWIRRKE